MLESVHKAKAAKPEMVFVVTNQVGKEHHHVRSQAYPYDVRHLGGADGDVQQDLVIEARRQEDHEGAGQLLGFINIRGNNYIVDLAVAPAAQGMGLGASLIREAAKECLERLNMEKLGQEACNEMQTHEEKPLIKLHVRHYNLQARALYLKLGFKETERCFPAWYDWHGGVSMEISIEKLLNLPAPPLPSQIASVGFLMQKAQKNFFTQGSQFHASRPKLAPKAKPKPDVTSKGVPKGKVGNTTVQKKK